MAIGSAAFVASVASVACSVHSASYHSESGVVVHTAARAVESECSEADTEPSLAIANPAEHLAVGL